MIGLRCLGKFAAPQARVFAREGRGMAPSCALFITHHPILFGGRCRCSECRCVFRDLGSCPYATHCHCCSYEHEYLVAAFPWATTNSEHHRHYHPARERHLPHTHLLCYFTNPTGKAADRGDTTPPSPPRSFCSPERIALFSSLYLRYCFFTGAISRRYATLRPLVDSKLSS